jgi:polyisoprenoid-binding protein YceI
VVKWEGAKVVGGAHHGTIKIKSADLVVDKNGEPTSAKIVIDMNSIEVGDKDMSDEKKGMLKGHLVSKDFFEVEKFGEASYVAKKFTKVAGKDLKYTVEGDLTIKGITLAQSITMEIEKTKTATKVDGELNFDRTKFNVMYSSGKLIGTAKDKLIKDDVELDIELALVN